jgi:hypothetical protein
MTNEEIAEINAEIEKMVERIQTVRDLLSDYAACKSEVSKKIIDAALRKYAAPFTPGKSAN